ncbi:MAG: FtsX-like permease family protein [Acidobacteria bacterium]|nr:MAG: FtsX-like permease family protein [Acidobacteriota bacterium]
MRMPSSWTQTIAEPAALAIESLRTERTRSVLAVAGVVIGIVTVVLTASILANARNQVALLFRDLGTENVFAFHLTGDPYVTPSETEAGRRPLKLEFVREIKRMGTAVRDVGAQVIVPTAVEGQVLVARAGGNESDTVLVEGATASLFDIIGADFARGRPFTDLEDREGARVAVVGANLAQALFGTSSPLGRTLTLAGDTYTVVGELAKRRGGFFGENRQDNVLNLPAGTARKRFGDPDRVVIYIQAKPGMRQACLRESEVILRLLRKVPPEADNDFTLSTADQIIATFDSLSARIGLVGVSLAAVSLLIGAIGIANVMLISVTERTREIGLRLAVGARRRQVLVQFLLEAAFLAAIGGVAGVLTALTVGALLTLVISGFSAVPPLWAVAAGLVTSVGVGVAAGYWPAQRAAALAPVEALRHE